MQQMKSSLHKYFINNAASSNNKRHGLKTKQTFNPAKGKKKQTVVSKLFCPLNNTKKEGLKGKGVMGAYVNLPRGRPSNETREVISTADGPSLKKAATPNFEACLQTT